MNLENLKVQELSFEEKTNIEGGFWQAVLVGVVLACLDDTEGFSEGFSDGYN